MTLNEARQLIEILLRCIPRPSTNPRSIPAPPSFYNGVRGNTHPPPGKKSEVADWAVEQNYSGFPLVSINSAKLNTLLRIGIAKKKHTKHISVVMRRCQLHASINCQRNDPQIMADVSVIIGRTL
jgi:hypothetical protein